MIFVQKQKGKMMNEKDKVIAELEWFKSVLQKGGKVAEYYEAQSSILTKAIKLLEQPERPKGEWIDETDGGFVECPFCHSATNCDGNKDELHFCFSCGAELR